MTADQRDAVVATCIRALPDEGCGVLSGTPEGVVLEVVPSENVAHSARVYEIDSRVLLRAFRLADDDGVQVIGVFHSHTHSDPYPSPTDVAQAPDPAWHYVLVGLRDVATVLKSYRIVEGNISSEEVTVSH